MSVLQTLDPGPLLLSLSGLLVWALSLPLVNVRMMNNMGLISVLPPSFFLALLFLTLGFCLALRRVRVSTPTLLVHVAVLILILYGTPALVEEVARFPAAWSRAGIVDYIVQHGSVDPHIDAYFNWPGFFTACAMFMQIAGISNITHFIGWANVFFNVVYLAPLWLIFSSMTRDRRLIWLSLWFFYLGNWVGQDYFAPQGFDFALYLVIIGILLHWFKVTPGQPSPYNIFERPLERGRRIFPRAVAVFDRLTRRDEMNASSTSWQRVGLMFIVIFTFGAMVPTHQLTPFGVVFVVGALVVFDRIRTRSLPFLMVVILVGWMSFMAVAYFTGHLASHVAGVGAVDNSVQRGLVGRVKGSTGHRIVVDVRIALSVTIGVLALFGGLRRFWQGREFFMNITGSRLQMLKPISLSRRSVSYQDLTMALIAFAPFTLIIVQGYGGEIFLRTYLYALPALAFFAAALFVPSPIPVPQWRTLLAIGLVCVLLTESTIIARYGNERADMFTAQEVAAMDYLYDTAPIGSVFVTAGQIAWRYRGYNSYKYTGIGRNQILADNVDSLTQQLADANVKKKNVYLIITTTGIHSMEVKGAMPPGSVEHFEQSLIDSGKFTVVFKNGDATVYQLTNPDSSSKPVGLSARPRDSG